MAALTWEASFDMLAVCEYLDHTGYSASSRNGCTQGYVSGHTPDGVVLRINEEEAAIVRRIFEVSAGGASLMRFTSGSVYRCANDELSAIFISPVPSNGLTS
jgi:hypothetical protein